MKGGNALLFIPSKAWLENGRTGIVWITQGLGKISPARRTEVLKDGKQPKAVPHTRKHTYTVDFKTAIIPLALEADTSEWTSFHVNAALTFPLLAAFYETCSLPMAEPSIFNLPQNQGWREDPPPRWF